MEDIDDDNNNDTASGHFPGVQENDFGLYCITTAEMWDLRRVRHLSPVIKVGCTACSFEERLNRGYRTYFPDGVYVLGLVVLKRGASRATVLALERRVHDMLRRPYLGTPSQAPDAPCCTAEERHSEWFGDSADDVHAAFQQLHRDDDTARYVHKIVWYGPPASPDDDDDNDDLDLDEKTRPNLHVHNNNVNNVGPEPTDPKDPKDPKGDSLEESPILVRLTKRRRVSSPCQQ